MISDSPTDSTLDSPAAAAVAPAVSPLRCPTCGAPDQTQPECSRCRTDLRLLHRVELHRAGAVRDITAALGDARFADALAAARLMHQLQPDDASFRWLAICQLLCRDPAAAFETHRQWRAAGHRAPIA